MQTYTRDSGEVIMFDTGHFDRRHPEIAAGELWQN